MIAIFRGGRPDITPAQSTAIIAAVVQLLRAFGIYDVTPEQQDALNVACGLLLAVVIGDVGIRAARNAADAKVQAAALTVPAAPPTDAAGIDADHEAFIATDEDLPSDEDEFAAPPDQDSRVTPDEPAP